MKCLVPNCDHDARTRGLCSTHYNQAQRLVAKGLTCWSRLEGAGFCLPDRRQHRGQDFAAWAASQINQNNQNK